MPNRYAADTMALILYLEKRKLPSQVIKLFTSIENGNVELIIPAIVVAEIGYLSERNRIDISMKEVKKFVSHCKNVFVQPLTIEIVETAFEIYSIPELHDRLIAATALVNNTPLITNDPVIHNSKGVKVVWD